MADIVTRLRNLAADGLGGCCADMSDAADEIERLRAAGDELATRLRWWTDNTDESYPDHEALQTWEEVVRG